MIKIDSIKITAKKDISPKDYLKNKLFSNNSFTDFKILRKSVDSRDKNNIFYIYSVSLKTDSNYEKLLVKRNKNISFYEEKEYILPEAPLKQQKTVIIGSGPAGLFCAYVLSLAGLKPLIIERGEDADTRNLDVNKLFDCGILNENSNVIFGEGGAGTFSDGKLNTQIKDKEGRIDYVLKTFNKFGASEDILYDSKPHIGTDVLINVVKNMRNYIESAGGKYLFNTQFVSFEEKNGKITGINVKSTHTSEKSFIECDKICLAIGHSARDTFEYLKNKLDMSPKPFAMGFRVIHTQEFINKAQYGEDYGNLYENLPVSPYKLTYTDKETDRGVYSFCMCPGGYVVNASSEKNKLCINGMSLKSRDSGYANSAIIVQIKTEDFKSDDILGGIELQRELEHKAFELGNGKIPVSEYKDFSGDDSLSECNINPKEAIKGQYVYADLRNIFPDNINKSFIDGMHHFNEIIKGFETENPLIAGIEARTSSPVRIERDDNFEASIKGIYPCGEGAGYAGGIVSAAVDGIKTAEKMLMGAD